MKKYFQVRLGKKGIFAKECYSGNFIGVDYLSNEDLTNKLPEEWREFNKEYIPIFLKENPEKSKIAAGLACGALWTVAKGITLGDVVLCPDGSGSYHVGEITSEYLYLPGEILPHRRSVQWYPKSIDRASMSQELKNSTGSLNTTSDITRFTLEIERLIGREPVPVIVSNDPEVENPAAFVMESHLEDFLVENWAQTELGNEYVIYEEEGNPAGQQFMTDTGPMDILAVSKDKKKLLVVELKKGRASDAVVGQILRYMGYVREVLAEDGQTVSGVIIALEDDQKIRRALSIVPSVTFYRYQISFKLVRS